jgi:hypothetical protein
MKKSRIRTKTLENVLSFLDRELELPLSLDDALYARWKIHDEIFRRDYEKMRERFFKEWSEEYLVKFMDGYYEKGQLVKTVDTNKIIIK